jgi:hypothetical protein
MINPDCNQLFSDGDYSISTSKPPMSPVVNLYSNAMRIPTLVQ